MLKFVVGVSTNFYEITKTRKEVLILNELIDRALIFIACAAFFFVSYDADTNIAIILLSFIAVGAHYYTKNKWLHFAFFFLYLIASTFFDGFLFFLPCMLYDPIRYPYRYICFLSALPLIRSFLIYGVTNCLMIGIVSCFCICLSIRTMQIRHLHSDYHALRDNDYELSLIQEEKNRNVLENQDYEVNLAMLNERNRISKELHDNIGHLLSRTLLQIGALLIVTKDETTKAVLNDLSSSISTGMDEIRATIHNMHDESVDLYSSIYTLVKDFTFCKIKLDYDVTPNLSLKLKYCLISIVKESLNNIMKHSNATEVNVILREHPGLFQIIIEDNGTLTSEQKYHINQLLKQSGTNSGMGLQNIVDRVAGFDGSVRFRLEAGFQTYITIPKSTQHT